MRQDPVDIEREARLELAAASQRLRSELDQSALEMNTFRRATQQATADALEELKARVEQVLENSLTQYEKTTEATTERITQTVETFTNGAEKLSTTTSETIAAIEGLTSRIEAIEAPSDLIENKIAPATETIADLTEALKTRTSTEKEEYAHLQDVIKGASATAVDLQQRVSGISDTIGQLETFTDTLDKANAAIADFASDFGEAHESLASGSALLGNTINAEIQGLKEGFASANNALSNTSETLRTSITEPAEQASAALKSLAAQAETLAQIEKHLEQLPSHLEAQIAELERIRKPTKPTRSSSFFRWTR